MFVIFFTRREEAHLIKMSSKIAAGQRQVDALVSSGTISPQDVGYLIYSVDPFHDNVQRCHGMPDATMSDQVTVNAPYQINFGAPPGTTTPWAFSVVMYPWTNDTTGAPTAIGYNQVGNWLQTPASPFGSQTLQGVSVYRGADGNPLGPFRTATIGNVAPIGLGLQGVHTKGRNRTLGMAFEIYDTSAVVNKQGTCTSWRQNTNIDAQSFINVTSTVAFLGVGTVDVVPMMRPPETVDEANRLLGTVSWRGEDGTYVVAAQNVESHPARLPDLAQPLIMNGDFQQGPVLLPSVQVISGGYNQVALGATLNSVNIPANRWNFQPYHQCGAFFTGLNPSSTYMLRVRYVQEREPSIDEGEITLLTERATGYNPIALEMRTRCMQKMPVACPVGQNGFGDYFWSFVSDIIPSMAGTFLGPLGALGGSLLKARDQGNAAIATRKAAKLTRKALPQVNQGPTLVSSPVVTPASYTIVKPKKKKTKAKKEKALALEVRDLRNELSRERRRDDVRMGNTRRQPRLRPRRRNSF